MVQITFSLRWRICWILACVICLNTVAAQTQLNNWMSGLDGSKSISEFSIPGTHESSAIRNVWNSACQNWTLGQQLDRGIRYLDIRCRHIKNSFAIHHAGIYQNIYFDNVLDSCRIFLKNNPRETII